MLRCSCPYKSLWVAVAVYGVTNDSYKCGCGRWFRKSKQLSGIRTTILTVDPQKGGAAGHDYDADAVGQTYGYTMAGAAIAGELEEEVMLLLPFSTKTNMCGGKKKTTQKE